MVKYVDADKAIEIITEVIHDTVIEDTDVVAYEVREAFISMPTADVQEVKHGQWQQEDVVYGMDIEAWQSAKCSACGRFHTTPFLYYFNGYNYCPHCGAKMDGR